MGVLRSVIVAVLVGLLTANLFAANAVAVVDRTALDGEFVTTTLEEEDAYEETQAIVVERVGNRLEESSVTIPDSFEVDRIVRDSVTRDYLEEQTDRSVEGFYGYLHGDRSDPTVSVNLEPVKSNVATAVADRIREMTVAELIDVVAGSEDLTISQRGVTIDLTVVGSMARSESEYREARQSLRQDVRQRVEEEAPEGTSDERIEDRVDQVLANIADRVREQVGDRVEAATPEELQSTTDPMTEMMMVGIRGLTTDMSYETFRDRLSGAKSDLAAGISAAIRTELDERVDDQVVLLEEPSSSTERQLRRARTAVGTVDRLTLGLPAAGIVVIGLIFLVTRSLSTTLVAGGSAMAAAGGASYVAARRVPGLVESGFPTTDLPPEAIDVVLGVIDQTAGVYSSQSLTLLGLGVGVTVVGIAVRVRYAGD